MDEAVLGRPFKRASTNARLMDEMPRYPMKNGHSQTQHDPPVTLNRA